VGKDPFAACRDASQASPLSTEFSTFRHWAAGSTAANGGAVPAAAGLLGAPPSAPQAAVAQFISSASQTGARLRP
jgi:hypothetical protein